jgi:flagellar biosynthetic protein FliS
MTERQSGDIVTQKAAKRYREEQVNGLSQKELILMLYDGALKFTAGARDAFGKKDFATSYKFIVKARDIVTELLCILNVDQGGEVAMNLQRLYVYVIGRLTEANFTHEVPLLDNVLTILQNLRSAWAEVDFEKALASVMPDNGRNGDKGVAHKPPAPRQNGDNARIISLTV